jgi:hypothetical protein
MDEEANRQEASESHREKCNAKLQVLLTQREDLGSSIDDLLQDIASGSKYLKVYKQMKMYNDEDTNPVLYKDKS